MKHKPVAMLITVPAALLVALAVGAQQAPPQTPTQSQQMQRMQQTQPAVPTTTQNIQCGNGGNCYDTNTTDRDSSGKAVRGQGFSSLAGSKGYVTRADAQNDPWLARHFDQCDQNRDGKITRSEYRACHRRNPSGGPP